MSRRSHQRRPRPTRRAVTLLEVILALGILCTITSLTYWFYSSSLETSRTGTAAAQKLKVAIVLSYAEYQRMVASRGKLTDFFRQSPLVGADLDLSRDTSQARDDAVL